MLHRHVLRSSGFALLSLVSGAAILVLVGCKQTSTASLPLPALGDIAGHQRPLSPFLAQVSGGNGGMDLGVVNGNARIPTDTHTVFIATNGTGQSDGVTDSVLPTMSNANVMVYEYTGQEGQQLAAGKTGLDAFGGNWYFSTALVVQYPQLANLPKLEHFTANREYDIKTDVPLVLTSLLDPAFKGFIAPVYRCGDAIVEPQQVINTLGLNHSEEQCDDGNTDDTDMCDSQCQIVIPQSGEHCGNGKKEGLEVCDHGDNTTLGCTLDCQVARGFRCSADNVCQLLIPDFGGQSSSGNPTQTSSSPTTGSDEARLVISQLPLQPTGPLIRGKDDQPILRFQMASTEDLYIGSMFFQQEADMNPDIIDVWPVGDAKLWCDSNDDGTPDQLLTSTFKTNWPTIQLSNFLLPNGDHYQLKAGKTVSCEVRVAIKNYTATTTFGFRFASKEYGLTDVYVSANNQTTGSLSGVRTNGTCSDSSCDIAVTLTDTPQWQIANAGAGGGNNGPSGLTGPWQANGNVWAMKKLGNTLFIGGTFSEVDNQPRYGVAAVDATTGNVLPWNPNADFDLSLHPLPDVYAMALDGNTLYIGGDFSWVGGQVRNRAAAIDATTGTLLDWNPGHSTEEYTTPSTINTLVVIGDTLYGGGDNFRGGLIAWNKKTGDDITTWSPGVNHYVNVLYPMPGGNLLVGGSFDLVSNTSGPHFGPGIWTSHQNLALVSTSTGDFQPWKADVDGPVYTALVNGTNVFIGGSFSHVAGQPRQNFATINAPSAQPMSIVADANGPVWSFLLDGFKLYIGGAFSRIANQDRPQGIGVIDPYVGGLLPWTVNADALPVPRETRAMAVDAQSLYAAGGHIDIFNNAYTNPIAKIRK